MKSLILRLFILFLPFLAHAIGLKPGPDAVIVKVLDKPLPAGEKERHFFLWGNFANKPDEQKFNVYTTKRWKENFGRFAKALIRKADEQKLDSSSLGKLLDLVLKNSKDEIAYLPVGAYQTTLEGKLVWIITVKWEYPGMGAKSALGHICMFAFDQETLKQVGFVTCG